MVRHIGSKHDRSFVDTDKVTGGIVEVILRDVCIDSIVNAKQLVELIIGTADTVAIDLCNFGDIAIIVILKGKGLGVASGTCLSAGSWQ